MRFATFTKSVAVIAALLAGQAYAATAPVELVQNGGFETLTGKTVLTPGHWDIYTSIPGWTLDQINGIEVRNAVAGNAPQGNYFVELDTRHNSIIEQAIPTIANQHYTLSFEVQNRPNVGIDSLGIEVYWGSERLKLNTIVKDWTTYKLDVVGAVDQKFTTLKFKAVGVSDSYGTSLDNVSVMAAVPEPETYGMLLAGLALVGVVARRKVQRA